MSSPCANHPGTAGANLCDECDRFLCVECSGPPIERVGRVYYYCKAVHCQESYLSKTKRELFGLAGISTIALLFLVVLALGKPPRDWLDGVTWLPAMFMGSRFAFARFLEYRERKQYWGLA